MPASRRRRSARSNRANWPTSSSSTAIRPRSTRKRSPEPKCSRPGLRGGRYGRGTLAARSLSAVNEHRARQHLRELLGLPTRRVPEVVRNARAATTFQEARDCGVAIGPVASEHMYASLVERIADFASVDRRRFVDLAGQAPVGGEIDEHRLALPDISRGARLAPGLRAGNGLRCGRAALRDHNDRKPNNREPEDCAGPGASPSLPLPAAGQERSNEDPSAENDAHEQSALAGLAIE